MADIDKDSTLILDIPAECTSCHHECHCDEIAIGLHADEYGICTCEKCEHYEEYEKEEKYNIEA